MRRHTGERSIPVVCLVALWRLTIANSTAPPLPVWGIIDAEAVLASAALLRSRWTFPDEPSEDMDHLRVLRDKISRFREEIADIQELNAQFRHAVRNGAVAQVAHGRRQERLQAIQHELIQLADLGRRVVSTEQINEKPLLRLHPVKRKRAA
jgi:hypothetical protein